MTHEDLFQLRKWYNPDTTILSEIDFTNQEIKKMNQKFIDDSHKWGYSQANDFLQSMKDKKSYLEFLRSKTK